MKFYKYEENVFALQSVLLVSINNYKEKFSKSFEVKK